MEKSQIFAPWLDNYGEVPKTLDYFGGTMYEYIKETADTYKDSAAFDFMGKTTSYGKFLKDVDRCAGALKSLGIKKGDRVTVALPNCPQAVVAFYAINKIGAVSNMIHPLSSENEIKFFINKSKSVLAITLDQFYPKFSAVRPDTCLKYLVITRIADALPFPLSFIYPLINKQPEVSEPAIKWTDFLKGSVTCDKADTGAQDIAVILYSGGTTGTTKGIQLTNYNFNALSKQIIATNPMFCAGDKMLAVMPMFHGFGLGVSIHSMLTNGGRCLLVPRFTPKSYAQLIKKQRPNFIAGVPTLFEALTRQDVMKNCNLSCLKGVFSGGDSLSPELKAKFDGFLKSHRATVKIREGYGTTECVTASCLTPIHLAKTGSIGQPFPDTFYKIVKVGSTEAQPIGEDGEICIKGPTVMRGYMDNPEETALALKEHDDGHTWLHTGDLGYMDGDGFIYFKQRIKRMIVTSGYNVYPSQLESILDAHELVQMSCVIGLPDPLKIQKIKAFIMLKDGIQPSEEYRQLLFDYCKKNIAKYALPYDIEFRAELPKTLVGKVAYRVLEQEELTRHEKRNQN